MEKPPDRQQSKADIIKISSIIYSHLRNIVSQIEEYL